jgi:hypothetical protein
MDLRGSSRQFLKNGGMVEAYSDEIVLRYADDFSTVFEAMLDVINRVGKADKPRRKEGILSGTVTASMPFTWSEMRVKIYVERGEDCTVARIHTSASQLVPGEAERLTDALKVVARFVLGQRNLSLLTEA